MTAATLTLTDFLLARIAEDEAAVTCWHGPGCANQDFEFSPGLTDCNELNVGPRRWLAECEAKRRIVDAHGERWWIRRLGDDSSAEGLGICDTCTEDDGGWDGPSPLAWPCPTLRALAAVYADHPDYREEWRP